MHGEVTKKGGILRFEHKMQKQGEELQQEIKLPKFYSFTSEL